MPLDGQLHDTDHCWHAIRHQDADGCLHEILCQAAFQIRTPKTVSAASPPRHRHLPSRHPNAT
uniref:Uncharacterized protein n=1 Tax=Oryza sativa subsp. japonica TaxID=39947 RepID=Q6YYQ9_ORYSJ|nr:hypothetical protein [Oryza sativa Japonica Group]